MKQENTHRKLMIAGVAAAAILTIAGPSASAQTTSTTTTTTARTATTAGNLTTAIGRSAQASEQMIQEACQRSKARRAKFLQNGTPEQFGSEEPFTFDPNAPPC
jgi:maltose-binding protein MalE